MNTDLTMVRRPECDACAGLLAVAASVATVCLAYHAALGQDANRIEANSGLFGVRVIATYRPDDRAERWEPRAITVSESGGLLFVVDASRDALFVHVRNRENGKLKLIRTFQGSQSQLPLEGATAVDGLLGPSGLAVCADLATSCVSARASDSLFVFSGDASVGIRSEVQRIRNGMDGVRGLDDPQQVVFSPDEKSVYVVCPGADAIVVFERNPKTGKLLFVQCIQSSATQSLVSGSTVVNGLLRPTQLAVSPDGLNVYVTGFKDNSLCCFSRDVNSGELAHIETHQDVLVDGFYRGKKHGLVMANAVSVSPDGKNVYVGTVPGKLGAWERSKADGTVVFMESLGNNTDGVSGIEYIQQLRCQGQPFRLFAVGQVDCSIAVFGNRNNRGMLSFQGKITDSMAGVTGLRLPLSLAFSPDGKHAYIGTSQTLLTVLSIPASASR